MNRGVFKINIKLCHYGKHLIMMFRNSAYREYLNTHFECLQQLLFYQQGCADTEESILNKTISLKNYLIKIDVKS